MGNLRDNLLYLKEEIDNAAQKTGRTGSDIALVAVSKTQSADTVRAGIEAGIEICGENRVQELLEKKAQGAYEGAALHLIGHLQKNKVRKIVGAVELIQSVDSLPLLMAIDRVAEEFSIVQDVLIQVNIGKDPDKFGIHAPELGDFLAQAGEFSHVRLRGLMTMPPFLDNPEETRRLFAQMFQLFVDIKDKTYHNIPMDYLSMGMSGDFFDAILEGANMVRVGSSIFGSR